MSLKSIDDIWRTIKLIPFAVILYDAKEHTYKLNALAQTVFDLSHKESFNDNDFERIKLINPESKKQLIIKQIFENYLVMHENNHVFLQKKKASILLNTKLAKLEDAIFMATFEIINKKNEQYNFDKIISKISTDLIDIQNNNINKHIEYALKAIGTVCHADRSYLFKFSENGETMRNTHEWVNYGIEPFKEQLQKVPKNSLPYFASLMDSTHLFRVDDITKLPKQAKNERDEFQSEGIKSVLCIGLRYDQELVGFIGCDCVRKKREWTDLDLIRLKLVGEIIANAFKNINYKQELQHIQKQLIVANQKLNEQVNTDGLTKIANRRCFDQTLQNEILRCIRHKQPISLIMCDIDFFKNYNDNYGHQQGDDVLKTVAQELHELCKRQGDLAARYGGEEFAVILSATDTHNCSKFATIIKQKIANLNIEHNYSSVSSCLTVSIGFCSFIPNQSTTPEELISNADTALYNAKKTGRNKIASFYKRD
ncbi:sensor domain-containing diguanylate cyclase [Pseudoalteromonas distincta]|uniref:sensor domain-containing diguanylate cyclase n=1 Tax=Pseudoalteromonas distincta TaxID=77608 RepID=UPI0032E2BB3E